MDFGKYNKEKVFRYSIRKYHFGAASVAVAALMFFANGAVAASETITPATANEVARVGSDGDADGDPGSSDEGDSNKVSTDQPAELKAADELKAKEAPAEEAEQGKAVSKPAEVDSNSSQPESAQEKPQAEGEKEQEQPAAVADTTAAKSTQSNLQALLANLTLDSMKALHDEVEAGLAAANAVLSDPKATQAQVDEQTRAMEALISRVNQALTPSLETPTILEKAGLTSTGLTPTGLATPEGAAATQASRGKRRRGGDLSASAPAANQDAPSAGGNTSASGANSQTIPQELPTYTNTEGKNGVYDLKDELESITNQLRANNASEDKIQAAKAAADKFNEAFSKGGTISQEDFNAALADLKKSRALIEGVLAENEANGGEVTGPVNSAESATPSANNVTIQPRTSTTGWSGFRSMPAGAQTRSAREAGQNRDASNNFENSRQFYFEDGKYGAGSGYDKYSYIFYSKRELAAFDNNNGAVSEAPTYIYAEVNRINNGFAWNIYVNRGNHGNLAGSRVWFTVPKNQVIVKDSINIGRGKDPDNGTSKGFGDNVVEALRDGFTEFSSVSEGTPKQSNIQKTSKEVVERYPVGNLGDLSRYTGGFAGQNYYIRNLESSKDIQRSNAKFNKINDSLSTMYSFTLPDTADAYRISFITRGDNIPEQLVYAVGMRGTAQSKGKRVGYLVNQFYARTNEDLDKAESNKFKILGNTYFKINQNTINAELGAAEGQSRSKNGIDYIARQGDYTATQSKMNGVLTYDSSGGITDYNSIDISSYGDYYETNGITKKNRDKGQQDANDDGQQWRFYKYGSKIEISKSELTFDAIRTPGVHTYEYVRTFTKDGSGDKGKFSFVTKPKRPTLDTDLSRLDEGHHTLTASNGTEGYNMVLYKKAADGTLTKVAEQVAGAGGRATFENVDLKLGEYVVKTVVKGTWYDYRDNDKEHKTVESDESDSRSTIKFKMGVTTDGSTIKQEHTIKYPVNDNVSNNSIKFIAKGAQNIKSLTVTGGEAAGIVWKTDGLNTQTATIRAENGRSGFAPNKAGVYKLTVTATSTDNSTQTYTARLFIAPSKGSLVTRDSALQGKANEKPTVNANSFPSGLATNFTDGTTRLEWKALLVKGGQNNPQSYIQEAINYEIVASAPLKPNGTAEFTSANYKKDKIGTDSVRVIMALVKSGTDEVYEGITSSLSDNSVRATLPDFAKAPEFGRDETGFTAKIGHSTANEAELRYTDATGAEHTVGFSKIRGNWEKDKPNQNATIAVTADTSGGTATVHIPFGTARLDSDLKAKQKAADTNFSTESTYHVPADSSAPKVSLGDALLPTTEAAATTPLYSVTRGQTFNPPTLKVWDDTGSIRSLSIRNLPSGVTTTKFGDQFTAQTGATENNKYTGSSLGGSVAATQNPGRHVATIDVTDAYGHSQRYYFNYEIKPEAPTVNASGAYASSIDSTARSISGTAMPNAKVKITLQDGTERQADVNAQGNWTYTLANNETFTQTALQDNSVRSNTQVKIKQVVNNVESDEVSKQVLIGRAIVENSYAAGRDITVSLPHDVTLAYIQLNGSGSREEITVKKVDGNWTLGGNFANKLSIETVSQDNPSLNKLKISITDPKTEANIPYRLVAGTDKIQLRMHKANNGTAVSGSSQLRIGDDKEEWFKANATNTDPRITVVNSSKTAYTADGSLTLAGLKSLVTVTDAEDDANKTVGATASENLSVTVKQGANAVDLSNNKYLKKGNYTLTYTTTDAAGATVTREHTITVSSLAESKGGSIVYPSDAQKVAYGNSDIVKGNFTDTAKTNFAAKLQEVNRDNNNLPTINGQGVTFTAGGTNEDSKTVVVTFPDGSTIDVPSSTVAKPEAPTIDNVESAMGTEGLRSTSRTISGQAIAGAEIVKLTLQSGDEKDVKVKSDGSWSYTLEDGEYLTQTANNTNASYSTKRIKAVQVKNGVASDEKIVGVVLGKATVDTPYAAGRELTVHVPHDQAGGYIRIGGNINNVGVDIGLKKVNGNWMLYSPNDKIELIASQNTANKSITDITLRIKDSALENPPFTIPTGEGAVKFRGHFYNGANINGPIGIGESQTNDWILSAASINTAPTVKWKNGKEIQDGQTIPSPTVDDLKGYFEGSDAEDNAKPTGKTVGKPASDSDKLRVRLFSGRDTARNIEGTSIGTNSRGRIDPGDYTLVLSTRDATGTESALLERKVTVQTFAEYYRTRLNYPTDAEKVTFGNNDISNSNFLDSAKDRFKDKLQELNRDNQNIPATGVTYSRGTGTDKANTVTVGFVDGSTLPIAHTQVAKPEVPTITATSGDKLRDTDRTISGTAIRSASKVTLHFQDGTSDDVIPSDGRWSYTLPEGKYLRQTEQANQPSYSNVPVKVTQTAFDTTSDVAERSVAKTQIFAGKPVKQLAGNAALTELKNHPERLLNYQENGQTTTLPNYLTATWKEEPDFTTVGTRTATLVISEKTGTNNQTRRVTEVTVPVAVYPTVVAKKDKFTTLLNKELPEGEDASSYVQFKNQSNGNVNKPVDGVTVAWDTKPSTSIQTDTTGNNTKGSIRVTYSVTNADGTEGSVEKTIDINLKVYHATPTITHVTTTFGTDFGKALANSNNSQIFFGTNSPKNTSFWKSTSESGRKEYARYSRDEARQKANYLGKYKDGIQVYMSGDDDGINWDRSEKFDVTFEVKPLTPTVEDATSTATSLTVNNVNSGTTVELYDMSNPAQPNKIGETTVAKEGEFDKKDKLNVPLLAGKTLNPGAKIVAKVVYTSGSDKTESDNSNEVVIKHPKPANLTSTVKMNGDYEFTVPTDADKVTFNIPTENAGTKTVTLTSENGWSSTDTAIKKVGDKLVIPNGTLGTTNRTVNITETKGSGDAESASNNYAVTIPTHTAPTLSDVIVAAGATPTAEQISGAFTEPTKTRLVAKSELTAVPAGTSAEIPATLTYNDGSTEDVTITVKSKPIAPTITTTSGDKLRVTDRRISGKAMSNASKVTLHFQDNTEVTVTPNNGSWTYDLPEGTYLRQTEEAMKAGYSATKVTVTQTALGQTSDASEYGVVENRTFEGKPVKQIVGNATLTELNSHPERVLNYQENGRTTALPNYLTATWKEAPDFTTVGTHTATLLISEKTGTNNQTRPVTEVTVPVTVYPTVVAKQAKFGQVYGKALLHGKDAANYVKFQANGTDVAKPSDVEVAWQTKPSTAEAGLDKIGVVKVTYHVTDENGVAKDEVQLVTINTPVYHATVNNGGIYTTTFGTRFTSSTSASGGYLTPNQTSNVKYFWESRGYSNSIRHSMDADYLGKKIDKIQVLYPTDTGGVDYSDARSEILPIYFVVKPLKPNIQTTPIEAGQDSVTVNNVNSGTTVELYDATDTTKDPVKIGETVVAKEGNYDKKDNISVPLTQGQTLAAGRKIIAKVVYTSGNDRTESDSSSEVVIKHPKPAELTSTAKMNGDYEFSVPTDADKVTFNIPTENDGTKTVTLTSENSWASTDTAVKKVGDKLVIPNGTLGTTNRTVQITATKGEGAAESSARDYTVTVPKHEVETTKISKVIGGNTPTNAELLDAVTVADKASAILKDGTTYPTALGTHTIEVVVTYADNSTEIINVPYEVRSADKTKLTEAKDALKEDVAQGAATAGKTEASKAAYEDAKNKANTAVTEAEEVIKNANATEQEVADAKAKVDRAKTEFDNAKAGLVDKPTSVPSNDGNTNNSANTNNGGDTNNGGTTTPADSNSNSVTPGNSGNTPVPSVTTDDSSNTTPATPSSTVGQAQASTPAQETPVSTNTPNNSGDTATPSETRPVDKSELARLVEELETRLKDLDGIDQSVIDAAKIILGEGQEALRNADLTEAGLKEMTAKVKEALESLKGKQATKDEEETKETRKEQGHLPYGTMIGSLLAFLGLLLFLIARRKKESELKKLTKELTKVLQESDLTSVDAKVLDQAREALAQAVAFLANEKESDHTEDELIEKLKAILAQLR